MHPLRATRLHALAGFRRLERAFDSAFGSGLNPLRSKSSYRDGQTRFDLEGKTYFLYRSPDRAQKELANLHE